VFEVPAISTLGYYMRMDDDSLMNCEMSPNVDPFDVMRAEKYDYGYYKASIRVSSAVTPRHPHPHTREKE
jgi:hypothetical protein